MTTDVKNCLIVVLREEPALLSASVCPCDFFVFENRRYVDQGYGDFTGFYDWLRSPGGRVVGVRYYPVKEVEFLCTALAHLSYVVIDPKTKALSFYFSDDHRIESSISADQDFGDNRVYKSETREFAISFNADGFFAHAGTVVDALSTDSSRRLSRNRIEQ